MTKMTTATSAAIKLLMKGYTRDPGEISSSYNEINLFSLTAYANAQSLHA